LFEKINYLQDNVVASSHLVHNSIDELNRALLAADTTLNNAINAFGQLNFTKFLENVRYYFIYVHIGRGRCHGG